MCTKLTLIIKGSEPEARQACLDRGLEVLSSKELPGYQPLPVQGTGAMLAIGSTQVEASGSFTRVGQWFGEAPFEAPYPVGSLLWFREEAK
jgi:hypothetical protein